MNDRLDINESNQHHKIAVGISSCLLGEQVRYDGGHKRHSYIVLTLGEYFEFQGFCPELDIGLGVPRKPIRLKRNTDNSIRCVAIEDDTRDFSEDLRNCADRQKPWQQRLCGYILKKDSPSCGMEKVRVWDDEMSSRDGVGIYAQRLMDNLPWLPIEEEGRLGDAILRENFIQRVFALHRWRAFAAVGFSVAGLAEFHARHKLILMSHDQVFYQKLGQLVAATTKSNLADTVHLYLNAFMAALKIQATRENHVNVLQHVLGYLKRQLDADDKQELIATIEKYRTGQLPIIVPITLLNHYFRKFPNEYITNSWYMNPYPAELSLQNDI